LIAKFNFYDVYGYFLPGLLLLSLIWLPFGIIYGRWPSGELFSALLAIPLAYIAGQILQTFAARVFPSTSSDGRFPSDVVLDETDATFSSQFKTSLASRIKEAFDLDVGGSESKENSRLRRDALFLCRSALIKAKTALYCEQFQGMYSLMRGLTLAFLLGAFHIAGWCLVFVPKAQPWVVPCLTGALCLANRL
jgi:hypothetical protein